MRYTPRQVHAFVTLGSRRRRADRREDLLIARCASHADKSAFEEQLRELTVDG
jgi:hypothetical protein